MKAAYLKRQSEKVMNNKKLELKSTTPHDNHNKPVATYVPKSILSGSQSARQLQTQRNKIEEKTEKMQNNNIEQKKFSSTQQNLSIL